MGWPLRMFHEEGFYFVTSRCIQGRLLFHPSDEVNEVVGGVLARALQHSEGDVRLHGFSFVSNHFHLRGEGYTQVRGRASRRVSRRVIWRRGPRGNWPGEDLVPGRWAVR